MLFQQLTISYECLASIGNSLELDSMMSEVLITFARKTGAVSGSYFINNQDTTPYLSIGKKIDCFADTKKMLDTKQLFSKKYEKQIVLIPLKRGYLLLLYKNKEETVEKIASMLQGFEKKINLSISACEGVKQLEELNQKLEEKVEESIEQIRNNEKLLIAQSKQAIMGEMLEMIAHQWRQPITSIGMIANNIIFDMIIGDVDSEKINNELNKINTQVSHLSHTIDDFRDFFKDSKEKQECLVTEVIDGTLLIIGKQLEKNNIKIIYNNMGKNLRIQTYKNELVQVLLNIVGNSKDAFEVLSLADKQVEIECKALETKLHIYIRDNAGGISPQIINKIFEPYFSTKKKKNGTGLGLYMSMIIISEHLEGKIEVKNIGNGVEFEIILPLLGGIENE